MTEPALDISEILDPARLRRVWETPARPAAETAPLPPRLDEPAEGEASRPDTAVAEPAVFAPEPPREPITPAAALAAFRALEAELWRIFPEGGDARRALAAVLPARRAELEQAVVTAESAGAVPPPQAAAIAKGLDQLEDLVEALMHDAGWPR